MTLALHTIKSTAGTTKKRKRVGRGNASGHGTYSTRGLKGQKSRKGVSNLKRLGMKQVLLRTPKKRGFRSLKPKLQVVNLSLINDNFKDKDIIDPKVLLGKKLIDTVKTGVKVLGPGKLILKGLTFKDVKMSGSVKEELEKAGGTCVVKKEKKVYNRR
ncbi:50S ribosomal protein L15 [Candidatus Falkowbacteria bacterium RIFOXYB2_FULL_47_14]|uniref:Large ribosomal subunit protein uL15 n=1 Tax=Candidatus Falkowbacteria bacterium RIFOXYA2_FULL_47_19 TaxID=1797994 RepID=A0A1F5SHZ5_9BACT|nr:MAG: 50S ribosomal protein L15 [Candidatus Falkowbacteria bacterium RIFOXYA2_FULL_47_19]OGF35445.1 MAG: 50S ribosomal protein L15 [Candidatus Falkowbacteria bacterium RIFOXYC2_FULL_46_15]OGF42563.1 MAG: 50S ribosomal protein L15 [Candidatus Falkowbacteria bacterium RIFOXYB2_FULL_47_14]